MTRARPGAAGEAGSAVQGKSGTKRKRVLVGVSLLLAGGGAAIAAVVTTGSETCTSSSPDADADGLPDCRETANGRVVGKQSTTTEKDGNRTARRLCHASAPVVIGTVAPDALVEISGVVASRSHRGVLWVHNDSGDSPRLFALTRTGATLGTYPLSGASAADWEDLALGPGPQPGIDYVYVGDIGDNAKTRSEIQVYRVAEPDPAAPSGTLTDVATLRFRYPDGAHNAEALLVDPETGDLFVVTKSDSGASGVYRAAAPLTAGPTTLAKVGRLNLGSGSLITAGDIAPDGSAVVLRTYGGVLVWARARGTALQSAFSSPPCKPPPPTERQGEAIAIDPDGGGYVTISEGPQEPILHAEAP